MGGSDEGKRQKREEDFVCDRDNDDTEEDKKLQHKRGERHDEEEEDEDETAIAEDNEEDEDEKGMNDIEQAALSSLSSPSRSSCDAVIDSVRKLAWQEGQTAPPIHATCCL